MSSTNAAPPEGLLRSFPRVFWVANVLELLERAAYYGMNSVLAVYLSNEASKGGLGFTESSVGFLQSIVYAMTYVVPILGGALADRYGYRRMLMVSYGFLALGYFATGSVTAYGVVFAALLFMGFGAGLFKPIISGTLARSTNESNSGFGFGIYYWMINLGAFLAPLAVTWIKQEKGGAAVFLASGTYVVLMLIPTLLFFRDPPKPASTKSLKEVLGGAAMVLGDARFMLMIVLYSVFWILYFQNFGSVLWYLRDFVQTAPLDRYLASVGIAKFDAEHVTVVNAGTIILLQVFVSRLVKDTKPLPTMLTGMLLGGIGFLCPAVSQSVWWFVLGLVVFSLGEMTAHPKYYSYVGLVAPADKKAVYMGYAFLYGVIGSLVGSSLGGALYDARLKPLIGKAGIAGDLRSFWLFFVALNAVAFAGLALYNRFLSADTPANNARCRSIMLAVYGLIVLTGGAFLAFTLGKPSPSPKTIVQATIMLALGGGGVAVSLKGRHRPA